MFCSIKSNPSTISNTILGSGKFGFVIKAETETGHFKAIKNLYIYDEVANSNIDIISKICDDHTTLSTHKHDNIYEILKIETGEVKASHLKKLRKLVPSSECSEHGKKMLELVKILLSRIKNTQVINLQIHMKFYNTSLRIFLDMEPNTERNEYSEYKVVQDILDGLIFLHENFIYHGDIRPENIFILIPSIQSGKNAPVAIISDVGLSSSFMCNAQCLSTQAKLKKYPARGLEENKPRVDIFYTGCVALEVFQIVEQFSQNSLINKILYQDGTELIKTHGLVKNSKELIETFLCSTIVSDISSIKLELSASLVATSLELSDRLRKCDEGDIILLQPGQYVGPFYLDKKNIKLFAANCYVSLKPKDDSYDPIVHITSDGVSLEGIKLDMKDRPNSTGIMVNGDSVKIKDLNSYGGFNSVLLCGKGPYLENINIESSFNGIQVDCDGGLFKHISLRDHITGVEIDGSNNELYDIELEDTNVGVKLVNGNKLVNLKYKKSKPIGKCVVTWYKDGTPSPPPVFAAVEGLLSSDIICREGNPSRGKDLGKTSGPNANKLTVIIYLQMVQIAKVNV